LDSLQFLPIPLKETPCSFADACLPKQQLLHVFPRHMNCIDCFNNRQIRKMHHDDPDECVWRQQLINRISNDQIVVGNHNHTIIYRRNVFGPGNAPLPKGVL